MGNIVNSDGDKELAETHEELVVLDRSGRLQLPKDQMEKLGIKGGDKLKVELDEESGKMFISARDS